MDISLWATIINQPPVGINTQAPPKKTAPLQADALEIAILTIHWAINNKNKSQWCLSSCHHVSWQPKKTNIKLNYHSRLDELNHLTVQATMPPWEYYLKWRCSTLQPRNTNTACPLCTLISCSLQIFTTEQMQLAKQVFCLQNITVKLQFSLDHSIFCMGVTNWPWNAQYINQDTLH